MKLTLVAYLVIVLALSVLLNAFLGWQWAQAGAECKADKATAVGKANVQVRADETKRDTKLDRVTVETKAGTGKAVAKVKEQTRERAEAIDRVPAGTGCAAPVGLPSLDAAVDQARAAAGH